MGRAVPIMHSSGETIQGHLAAQVVASYFEEQMGREMELLGKSSVEECLGLILDKKAPMALVPEMPMDRIPAGVVVVLPGLNTGDGIFTLVMGSDAGQDLQFSLVPRYMERLSSGLSYDAWTKGIVRINGGEGVRKVALDMLREANLL